MALKKKVKEVNTGFGRAFDLDELVPKGCDLVVICSNNGGGLVPLSVRLVHQVYLKEFSSVEGLTIIPARHEEYIEINEIASTKRIK